MSNTIYSSKTFDINAFPKGEVSRFWFHVVNDGIGEPIRVPILVARGLTDGKVFGVNAALHGNELNGIDVIQDLFHQIDPRKLKGTLVGVLISNVPGVLSGERRFNDGFDLNRQAPGNANGGLSSVYIYRLIKEVIDKYNYFIDLHTTGTGKANTWHIRADMDIPLVSRLARLQNAPLILENDPDTNTLRQYCTSIGIPSITVEVGNPMIFQPELTEKCVIGIKNALIDFGFYPGEIEINHQQTLYCKKTKWVRTDAGGILSVQPQLMDVLTKGQRIAEVHTIFGDLEKEIFAPLNGIVIAKTVYPIAQTGSAVMHIGSQIEEINF